MYWLVLCSFLLLGLISMVLVLVIVVFRFLLREVWNRVSVVVVKWVCIMDFLLVKGSSMVLFMSEMSGDLGLLIMLMVGMCFLMCLMSLRILVVVLEWVSVMMVL